MIRRRRRSREIPFSFDSFLDVVANVVGIIIRLILVVWVGARSYGSLHQTAAPPEPPAAVAEDDAEAPIETDPLEPQLAAERKQLAEAEAALREEVGPPRPDPRKGQADRPRAGATRRAPGGPGRRKRAKIEHGSEEAKKAVQATALTGAELREPAPARRGDQGGAGPAGRRRRWSDYRTPVSKPVEAEELAVRVPQRASDVHRRRRPRR